MPFPQAWRDYLNATVHYPHLSPELRKRAERALLIFAHTKPFSGVGLEITDEMKAVVSFYAALATLNRPGYDYPSLKSVVLYADDFIVDEYREEGGIVTETPEAVLDGQSSDDTIALSWPDVAYEAYNPTGYNVVVHECAHILDFEADGGAAWRETLHEEFSRFESAFITGERAEKQRLLGEYAATNEAEFFAVSSECFFEQPWRLHDLYPEMYALLENSYGPSPTLNSPESPYESPCDDFDE